MTIVSHGPGRLDVDAVSVDVVSDLVLMVAVEVGDGAEVLSSGHVSV